MFKLKEIPKPGTKVKRDQFAEILCRRLLTVPRIFGDDPLQSFYKHIDSSLNYYDLGGLGVRKLSFELMAFILYQSMAILINNKASKGVIMSYLTNYSNMLQEMDRGCNTILPKEVLFYDFKEVLTSRLEDYSTIILEDRDEQSKMEYLRSLSKKFIKYIAGSDIYDDDKHLSLVTNISSAVSDITNNCILDYPIIESFW